MNTVTNKPKSWLERLSLALLREPQDQEQLMVLLRDAEQRELFDANALMMIEGVLQVASLQVRDIMIPRVQMVMIPSNAKFGEILPIVIESNHSRFPILDHSRDEIIGILLAKDLLAYHDKEQSEFDIDNIMRPAIFVPESKRLNILLQDFRRNRNHMAIVVDEYGSISGLVTIEDILEQIVGSIEDEYDTEEEGYIKKHSERRFMVSALTPIEEFNTYFSCHFEEDGFDTLGGLVTQAFGHLPKRGEKIKIGPFIFKIVSADGRRIKLIQVLLPKPLSQKDPSLREEVE